MAKQAFDVDGSRLTCLCPAAYDRLPAALGKTQPALFAQWLDYHVFGTFGGVRHVQTAFSLFYYLKNLLWFALPALPLAVWTVCRTRLFSTDWGILGVVWMLAVLVLLAVSPQRFQDNLVRLLPPLALFGAAQLDSLRRGAAAFVNWFGIMAFGLFAVFMWTGFFAMNYGWPAKLAERAAISARIMFLISIPFRWRLPYCSHPCGCGRLPVKTYAAGGRLPTGRQALP